MDVGGIAYSPLVKDGRVSASIRTTVTAAGRAGMSVTDAHALPCNVQLSRSKDVTLRTRGYRWRGERFKSYEQRKKR